jgi:hypothetical protein
MEVGREVRGGENTGKTPVPQGLRSPGPLLKKLSQQSHTNVDRLPQPASPGSTTSSPGKMVFNRSPVITLG